MHQCIISLGANYEAEKNLPEALLRLGQILLISHCTPAIWTEPIGSKRKDNYLNQLVEASAEMPLHDLTKALKTIEKQMGRTNQDRALGIVRIDLDILEYDGERHHQKDWERPYIQLLLPQL